MAKVDVFAIGVDQEDRMTSNTVEDNYKSMVKYEAYMS